MNLRWLLRNPVHTALLIMGASLIIIGMIILALSPQLSTSEMAILAIVISIGILLVTISTVRLALPVIVMIRTKEEFLEALSLSERKIVNSLAKAGGSLSQSEIAKITGFSPAKVSRVVRRLEEKGIIIRRREEKRKIVYLKKEFLDLLREKHEGL